MATKGYPSKQAFNINGTKNKTKTNSWWAKPPYHNNKQRKHDGKSD